MLVIGIGDLSILEYPEKFLLIEITICNEIIEKKSILRFLSRKLVIMICQTIHSYSKQQLIVLGADEHLEVQNL